VKKYRLVIEDGYANSRHPREGHEVEIDDDATEEEIEAIGLEILFEHISYSFFPEDEQEEDES